MSGPVVYFLRDEASGLIKIGQTSDMAARLSALRTATPGSLLVLGTIPGGSEVEKAFHGKFSHLRVVREWFRDDGTIAEYVSANASPYLEPARDYKRLGGMSDDKIAEALGCSRPYATMMRLGRRRVRLDVALRLHAQTGALIGPIACATQDEIKVLNKFVLDQLLASERG
jgi:hypothetical protein